MKTVGAVIAALFGGAYAGEYAIANFSDNGSGLTGYIKVANGHVMVDLDFSDINYNYTGNDTDMQAFVDACAGQDLSWHMHTIWGHNVDSAYGGDAGGLCGSSYTDFHFDPWFGCGGANGNRDCKTRWNGCVDVDYKCNTTNYAMNPLYCEVGDWSGQWGKISQDGGVFQQNYFSYWAPLLEDLVPGNQDYQTSVVLHCSGGYRGFCAGFKYMMDSNTYAQPDPVGMNTFDMKRVADGFKVDADDAGYTVYIPQALYSDSSMCSTWSVKLGTDWDSTVHSSNDYNACINATGMVSDPTHQCIEDSSSMYCMYDSQSGNSERCDGVTDNTFTYSCDGYMCAIGDVSGRIGNIDFASCTGENLYVDNDGDEYCMLRYDDDIAVPKDEFGASVNSITLTCSTDAMNVVCASLGVDTNSYDDDGEDGDDDDDSAAGFAVGFAVALATISAMFH